jgi:hypothetical protein
MYTKTFPKKVSFAQTSGSAEDNPSGTNELPSGTNELPSGTNELPSGTNEHSAIDTTRLNIARAELKNARSSNTVLKIVTIIIALCLALLIGYGVFVSKCINKKK